MQFSQLNSSGTVVASGNTSASGGTPRTVVYMGNNAVASLSAGGTQDLYTYSTQVGGSNPVNIGVCYMPDAPGSIVGVSMMNVGNNNAGNNNVQFTKNGSNLGPLQVLGPVTNMNTVGASFPAGTMTFVKGDVIRCICGNDTAGTFNCEVNMTVALATS